MGRRPISEKARLSILIVLLALVTIFTTWTFEQRGGHFFLPSLLPISGYEITGVAMSGARSPVSFYNFMGDPGMWPSLGTRFAVDLRVFPRLDGTPVIVKEYICGRMAKGYHVRPSRAGTFSIMVGPVVNCDYLFRVQYGRLAFTIPFSRELWRR